MSRETRKSALCELERNIGCPIISYVTADMQQGPSARIAPDVLNCLYRHLEALGFKDKLALAIHSRGGDTMVPWRFISLTREYCKSLLSIVLRRAHSAATLICLGADEILMGRTGELSPIDPSIGTPFNPTDPTDPKSRIAISVEDVVAFITMAKKIAGLTAPDELSKVFEQLTSKIHPLALGNVQRSHAQIRMLASKMLKLHMKCPDDDGRIAQIVDMLTEKLYSHQHMISRREATEIGLPIKAVEGTLEGLIYGLFLEYQKDLNIDGVADPSEKLGTAEKAEFDLDLAVLETAQTCDAYRMKNEVSKPSGQPVTVKVISQKWTKVE